MITGPDRDRDVGIDRRLEGTGGDARVHRSPGQAGPGDSDVAEHASGVALVDIAITEPETVLADPDLPDELRDLISPQSA